ncbi:MAG TPA: class I SAM-dependent methyltransferase [Patescibacteria group bacterium]|nr:class I SAM-dependent methyltransferase [Patescibacteria group bacterium]
MKTSVQQKILNLVQKNYNEIAVDFDMSRKKRIWPRTEEVCSIVKSGDKVLDLACGNGRLLESFHKKEIEYLGIDISEELINIAKKNYPNNNFIVGDLLDLKNISSEHKKYDHIFCLAALQHIPSEEYRLKVLQDAKSLLTDSGELIISNWNLWESKHFKKIIINAILKIIGLNQLDFKDIIFFWKDSSGNKKSKRYYHAFTKKELIKLSKMAGFKNIKVEKDKYNYWLILSN